MRDSPLHPDLVLTSYWRASWSDVPQPLDGRPVSLAACPPAVPRQCGRCGAPDPVLHDASDDSGTGWRQLYFQVRCEACGAFTLFHYDD